MKLLVTGATGFIGEPVVEELIAMGHTVVTTSRSSDPQCSWSGKTIHIPYDIESPVKENLFELFQKPDMVINLAWRDLDNYNSASHIQLQLPGHIAFLQNFIDNGVRDICVAGTCMEYGLQNGLMNEDIRTDPVTLYATAKDALRRYLQIIQKSTSFTLKWFRYFYMCGENQRGKSLIPMVENAIANGEEVFNMSGGEQLRDYLPVVKVAEYTVKAAVQNDVDGIINICSGTPISVRKLIEQKIEEKNSSMKLNLGYYPYPDYEPMAFWGDNRKLKNLVCCG